MASISLNGSSVGTALQELLMSDDIQPGAQTSYQMCKNIYLYHPLGRKIAEAPIEIAMSQPRQITIPNGPEERVRDRFLEQWEQDGIDDIIANVKSQSRVYGIASVAMLAKDKRADEEIDPFQLPNLDLSFNVFDPLNTAGSLVLNQDPNSLDFQKHRGISVSGRAYARSRCCVVMNENPIYIAYTNSAFGFVGRSAYQRALLPLKTFVQSMATDDMVTRKAGVLVAKMKQAGSIIDNIQQRFFAQKRQLLKDAQTDNVLGIALDEEVSSLNMENIDKAMITARRNSLDNIAMAVPMPAQMLNTETFAEGFGEGTEDAKANARFINKFRKEMNPIYRFFDPIVMHRAWTPEFYKTLQEDFPDEYEGVEYQTAFYRWKNSFKAIWPNLLEEPDSEKAKTAKVKLEAIMSIIETFSPSLPQSEKARLLQWAADNINEDKFMFSTPLELLWEVIADHMPEAMPAIMEPNAEDGGAGGSETAGRSDGGDGATSFHLPRVA